MMNRLMKPIFLLLLISGLLSSCNQVSVGTLDANVSPKDDVTGTESARARINFTDFSQPPGPGGNDDKFRAHLSNPEGDTLDIVLSPVSGGFPVQTYTFDGSTNTFEASFTVTFASGPQTMTETVTEGYLNLTGVTIDAGVIKSMTADFHVNFVGGGAGIGTVTY